MDEWFYLKDEQPHGPLTKDALLALFTDATLPADTLVRRGDIPEWLPARNIPDFLPVSAVPLPAIHPPPLPVGVLVSDSKDFVPSGPQVRPWVRYFARMLDTFVYSVFLVMLLIIVNPESFESPTIQINILAMVGIIFVESILLTTWGTTLGKALLNCRIRNEDGSKLTFPQALKRTFNVWMKGLCFGLPFVSILTNLQAYKALISYEKTSWDIDGHSTVEHRSIGAARIFTAVLLPFVVLGLLVIFIVLIDPA